MPKAARLMIQGCGFGFTILAARESILPQTYRIGRNPEPRGPMISDVPVLEYRIPKKPAASWYTASSMIPSPS